MSLLQHNLQVFKLARILPTDRNLHHQAEINLKAQFLITRGQSQLFQRIISKQSNQFLKFQNFQSVNRKLNN